MRFLATREVPITSTVGIENISTPTSVNATLGRFPTSSLPEHMVKPAYAAFKEVHQLFTANAASVKSDLVRGHNGYLGLILPPDQYAGVSGTVFVRPPDTGITAHIQLWTLPG